MIFAGCYSHLIGSWFEMVQVCCKDSSDFYVHPKQSFGDEIRTNRRNMMIDNVLKYVKRLISEGRDHSTWISG